MFTLRVLGTIELEGAGGRRIGSILSQPKRLAMLTLLALESPRRLQREEVMVLLWPELSQERGRNALRQALHYLRRSLGPGVVVGRNVEGIGVDPEKLECDATELLRAAAEGRDAEVLELYGGELLPGFHLDGAPVEYERWLERMRRRLAELAGESAWRVAAEEAGSANAVAAGVTVRRACEIGSWDEDRLLEVIEALVARGEVRAARSVYEDFAGALLREHGREPGERTRSRMAELEAPPEGGGAAAGSPGAATAIEEPAVPSTKSPDPSPEASSAPAESEGAGSPERARSLPSRWSWRRRIVAATGTALVLVVGTLWGARHVGGGDSGSSRTGMNAASQLFLEPVQAMAVDAESDRLAEVLSRELAAELSRTEGIRVVALSREEEAPKTEGIALRPSLRRDADGLRLGVLALDPSSSVVLDQFSVSIPEGAASMAPERVAARMALEIRRGVGELLSWQGLAARGIPRAALDRVREAAEQAEAADELRVQGAWEAAALAYDAADSLLVAAAEAQPDWAEPVRRRAELALQAMWIHVVPPNRQPMLAHRAAQQALDHAESAVRMAEGLDAARALETRGVAQYWNARTAQSEEEIARHEARAEEDLSAAVRLDPGLPRAWNTLSVLAERRGDFAVAYHRARKAYATDRDLQVPIDVVVRLFTNALEVGDAAAAAEWCSEAHDRRPGYWLGPYCDLLRQAWVGPWTVGASDSLGAAVADRVPSGPVGAQLRTRTRLLQGVILARAGEVDAAQGILDAVSGRESADPELVSFEAWVRAELGDVVGATRLLAEGGPGDRPLPDRILRSQRFEALETYLVVRSGQ